METLELTVASIEEALELAKEKWGVDPKQLEAKVLEESPGLFGKSKLKVLVTQLESAGKSAVKEEAKEEKPAKKRAPKAKKEEEEAPAKAAVAEPESSEDGEEKDDRPEVVATEEDAEQAVALLAEIMEKAEMEIEVKVSSINGRYVNLELDGKDTAHMIGKTGEVLNYLQYLMNIMMSRKFNTGIRVTLDGNNYRTRREEKLKQLATEVAEQVVARQEEAVFDALPAFERRVVHKVLAELEGVTTYSEGEEPNRRVVIAPA